MFCCYDPTHVSVKQPSCATDHKPLRPPTPARDYESRGEGEVNTVYAVTKWSENKTKEQNKGTTTKKKQCSKEQSWYLLIPKYGRSQRVWIWHRIATLWLSQLSLLCRVELWGIFCRPDLAIKRPLSNAYMYVVRWKIWSSPQDKSYCKRLCE